MKHNAHHSSVNGEAVPGYKTLLILRRTTLQIPLPPAPLPPTTRRPRPCRSPASAWLRRRTQPSQDNRPDCEDIERSRYGVEEVGTGVNQSSQVAGNRVLEGKGFTPSHADR